MKVRRSGVRGVQEARQQGKVARHGDGLHGGEQGSALAWHGNALTRELLASQGRSVAVPRSQNIGDPGPRRDAVAWNGDSGERVTTTRWAPAHKGVGGP